MVRLKRQCTDMSSNDLAERLRARRNTLEWTQQQAADAAGVPQQVIDRLERGLTRHSKYLNNILIAYGISSDENVRLPVVGYVGGGQQVYAIDDHVKGDGLEHIDAPPGVENGIALIVRGSSMAPRYRDGDYVVIEKIVYDITSLIGDDCYVKLADGRCFLKTLAAGTQPGRYTLVSIDGTSIPDALVEQAYPVAWIRPRRR